MEIATFIASAMAGAVLKEVAKDAYTSTYSGIGTKAEIGVRNGWYRALRARPPRGRAGRPRCHIWIMQHKMAPSEQKQRSGSHRSYRPTTSGNKAAVSNAFGDDQPLLLRESKILCVPSNLVVVQP